MRGSSYSIGLLVAIQLGVQTGCAAIPWSTPRLPAPAPVRDAEGLLDLRGVVHVHTEVSSDAHGRLADVLGAAHRVSLQWVAFSEHRRGDGEPFADWPSQREGVTLIPGWEMRSDGGSILALGVPERPPHFGSAEQATAWIHEHGGLAFVAHIEKSGLVEPGRYTATGLDGIELVNLHAQWTAHPFSFAARLLVFPARRALRALLEVPPAQVERLEELAPTGVLGGVDAHAKLRLLGRWGTLDRYADLFGSLTTHVWSRSTDPADVLDALRSGRSYVAFEGLAPVDHLGFTPKSGGFEIDTPRDADLHLICDGHVAAETHASHAHLEPPRGVRRCRLEAFLADRLWILSAYRDVGEIGEADPRRVPAP